ncbi:MAG: hypothetical protein M1832_005222 [Thelocarpon impressellum]|nr:MAG: hypothetical protein M1832_005222 [Thelocarpon impressellum]
MASGPKKFYNYPEPQLAPERAYHNPPHPNPVLRGLPLTVAATIVASSGVLQNFFWGNAGFGSLRGLKELDDYEPRYDPTVIPIEDASAQDPPAAPTAVPAGRHGKGMYHSAADFHALYRSGKATPTDVAEALLPLIRRDASPPGAHSLAFLESKVELIRAAAEASTLRFEAGEPLGPLDGVPVAVKDEVELDGYGKSLGSNRDFSSERGGTSWCVARWAEAGAVVLGKLTMHELGLDTTNNNPVKGTPLNPHNPHYYTGGSSGGSAYAVAAGLLPIALGADGGGSIRIPAAYCGVFGLKPSHGRVSGLPSVGIASTTGVLGPLAGTMEDLELAYRVMAAPDPASPSSALFPVPRPLSAAHTKLLGIERTWFARADEPVKALCTSALQFLTSTRGYKAVDVAIPFLPEGQLAHAMTILAEIGNALHGDVTGLTAANKILLAVGSKTPAVDFLQAQRLRALLMRHLAALFRSHPGLILLTPTTPNAGWPIGSPGTDLKSGVSDGSMSVRSMEYVWLANFAGLPSLSVPAGYAAPTKGEGAVPVGLMGTAEWGAEEALLAWGRDGEAWLHDGLEGGARRPGTFVDVLGLVAA